MRVVTAACIVAITMLPAAAQEPDRHAWFNSLLQPGTAVPCCEISDCHRTQAEWRHGQWWAVVAGAWEPMPEDKVLNKTSIFNDAVVCHAPPVLWSGGVFRPTIYCFVPPPIGF